MSDDGSGSTQNVKSVYPRRSLFQFSDAFRPQPSGERQSTQASLSHELRHRDGHGQSNPESFIVDIPLYDECRQIDESTTGSNISTYDASSNASCSNNAFSAGSQSPSVSSSESQNNCSIDGECSSTNNSASNKDSSYEAASSEETSDGEIAHAQEKEHSSTTRSSSDTGNESQKSLDSNKDDSESVSDSTSCKDSSDETVDYQQYMCQSNRNINAKKRKKSDKESEEESLVDEDKKGKKRKRHRSSSSRRRKSKGEGDDSEGEKSGSEGRKRRRSRSHSKSGKSRSGKDKKGRRKSRSGSHKRKKKGKGKEKGKPWNSFVNIFTKDTPYPPSVYFILGSEFCERFTYYGLRNDKRRIQAFKTKCLRKLLHRELKTKDCAELVGPQEPLLATIMRQKLAWFGPVVRHDIFSKTIVQVHHRLRTQAQEMTKELVRQHPGLDRDDLPTPVDGHQQNSVEEDV